MGRIATKNKDYVESVVCFDDLGKYIIDELGVPYAGSLAWLLYKVIALYSNKDGQPRFIDKRGFMNMYNDDFRIGVTDATLNRYFKELAELDFLTKEIRYESKGGSVKAYMFIKLNVAKILTLTGYSTKGDKETTDTQTAIAEVAASNKHLSDSLDHLDLKSLIPLANYIVGEIGTDLDTALKIAHILLKVIKMYTSTIDNYVEGKTLTLTNDLMMIKNLKDFDLSTDRNTFEKYLGILQNLGLIEQRSFARTYCVKPIASKIIEAYESAKEEEIKEWKQKK